MVAATSTATRMAAINEDETFCERATNNLGNEDNEKTWPEFFKSTRFFHYLILPKRIKSLPIIISFPFFY